MTRLTWIHSTLQGGAEWKLSLVPKSKPGTLTADHSPLHPSWGLRLHFRSQLAAGHASQRPCLLGVTQWTLAETWVPHRPVASSTQTPSPSCSDAPPLVTLCPVHASFRHSALPCDPGVVVPSAPDPESLRLDPWPFGLVLEKSNALIVGILRSKNAL